MMLAAAAACCATPAQWRSFEDEVLRHLNEAREHPEAMAARLRAERRTYRGNVRHRGPGRVDVETDEGVRAVDDAIASLGATPPAAAVLRSTHLDQVARDHVLDQGRTGDVGHDGSDGSDPFTRSERRGGGGYLAEVIQYGSDRADEVVRDLIVDDGVRDRGHRRAIYDAGLRYAGVSCGPHPEYRTMCTIDLSATTSAGGE